MNIHCFQHVEFEGLASIKEWIDAGNHRLSYTRFFKNEAIPELKDVDFLIVMGGPMSYDDEKIYSWMKFEKEFIKNAIGANKTVLGICLGAQMIADVINGSGKRGHSQEIGWFDLRFEKTDLPDELKSLPDKITAFHWHGDTFNIPLDAIKFASTKEYPNQGFIYNKKVMALQFHLEMNENSIIEIVQHCGNELVKGNFVQSADEILGNKDHFKNNQKIMFRLLDYLEKYSG